MSISFKRHARLRPERYRTPSPPRYAVEPLSPVLHANATQDLCRRPPSLLREDPGYTGANRGDEFEYQAELSEDILHHKSRGSMDIFASIALAIEPPKHPLQDWSSSSKRVGVFGYNSSRPTKRSRSEKLPSVGSARSSITRPATSGQHTPDARLIEAELLLHFYEQAVNESSVKMLHQSNVVTDQDTSDTLLGPPLPTTLQHSAIQHDDCPCDVEVAYPDRQAGQSSAISDDAKPALDSVPDVWREDLAPIADAEEDPKYISSYPDVPESTASVTFYKQPTEGDVDDMVAKNRECEEHHSPQSTLELSVVDSSATVTQQIQSTGDSISGKGELIDAEKDQGDGAYPVGRDSINHAASFEESAAERNLDSECRSNIEEDGDSDLPLPDNESRLVHGALDDAANDTELSLHMDTATVPIEIDASSEKAPPAAPGSQPRPPTMTAICAACNFARNSISIDIENQATSWISCDGCKSWFHFACAGFKSEREVRSVDKYRCRKCKPIHGATTYVRKSSRAHSAIDYAGLHQGVIKTSDDTPAHHYIQPIKDGTISFLPETFARMRPELVTADYFEKGSGMREPIVIPASLNPRPQAHDGAQCDGQRSKQARAERDELESNSNLEEWLSHDAESQSISDQGQDALDMVMPRGLTIRKVADLYGPDERIEVIDVKSQNGENKKWSMGRWADYYESPDDNKIVRNVISLEVSHSKLGKLIRRPQIVRDLDLQDTVWPEDLLAKGEYPRVQFYCLMSVADCFTDFHIDFGGSSVFYHILKGKKTFLFIPPKEKHLKKYEEWCMSPAQNWTFLADQTKECYRVDLSEGDTMLIPSGWIHAVWTPEDSLVIGGNFLTRMNYGMQLRIAQVEKATGVARKFRYPHFQKIHWYTVLRYLEDDPLPKSVRAHMESGYNFQRPMPAHHEFDAWGENSRPGPENYHARYYSQPELDGLADLLRYVLRTVLIDNGTLTEGITAEMRNAVKKSIPRVHGEPMAVVKTFAIWCAWKKGDQPIPHWAYPGAVVEVAAPDKLSAAASKKLAEEAALKAPRRQSARMQSQKEFEHSASMDEIADLDMETQSSDLPRGHTAERPLDQVDDASVSGTVTSLPSKRAKANGGSGFHRKTACDSCRRRRRACKHKEQHEPPTPVTHLAETTVKSSGSNSSLVGESLREKLSSISGLFDSITPKSEVLQVVLPPYNHSGISSGIDQRSSQKLDSMENASAMQSVLSEASNGQEFTVELGSVSGNASPSRPRTKACNYCRKSKRRCIHDAFGNEDPVKVAESAIPRPHARKSNKGDFTSHKTDLSVSSGSVSRVSSVIKESPVRAAPIANMLIAPTANMVSDYIEISDHTALSADAEGVQELAEGMPDSGERLECDHGIVVEGGSHNAEQWERGGSMMIDPALMRDSGLIQISKDDCDLHKDPIYRQVPASSMISPPESSNDDTGSSPTAVEATYPKSCSNSRQASQPVHEQFQRNTPESSPSRRPSSNSFAGVETAKGAGLGRDTSVAPVQETDEESMRLIKELQVQDLGLRRRGKI